MRITIELDQEGTATVTAPQLVATTPVAAFDGGIPPSELLTALGASGELPTISARDSTQAINAGSPSEELLKTIGEAGGVSVQTSMLGNGRAAAINAGGGPIFPQAGRP